MRFLLPAIGLLLVASSAAGQVSRHVLIVANNQDPDGRLPALRFADDDGARWAEIFQAAGARVELLTTLDADSQQVFPGLAGRTRPPTRDRFEAAVAHIFDNIARDRQEGRQTEFVFIYTGHGTVADGEGYVLLADARLGRRELLDRIVASSPADYNHLIIDACDAYYMVQSRGGWRDDHGGPEARQALEAFLQSPDVLARYPTTGVVVSTSGTAAVHEWDRLRSGVFSHELRSGLLGPADVDGDRRVTYGELEAFLAAANRGVTNPKARIRVYIHAPRQDLSHPLLDLGEGAFTHFLTFPAAAKGRFEVEDARGLAYADWNKAPDHVSRLALLYPPVSDDPGYFVHRGDEEMAVRLAPPRSSSTEIVFDEAKLGPPQQEARGSVAEAFRDELFSVPFGRAFAAGFGAGRQDEQLAARRRAAPGAGQPVHVLQAGYLLSEAMLPGDGLAHGLALSYRWLAWEHFHLGVRLSWSRADGGREANAHVTDDLAVLIGAGAHLAVGDRLQLGLDLAIGNHFLLYQRQVTETAPDKNETAPFAPALAVCGGLSVRLFDPLWLQARAGVSVVFAAPDGKDDTYFVPEGSLGLQVRF